MFKDFGFGKVQDQILFPRFAAEGKGKADPKQQIPGFVKIQPEGDRKSYGGWFAWFVI